MRDSSIYLDYNATAPLAAEVRDAMDAWLSREPANPSSSHYCGQRARAAVETARRQVAELLGVDPTGVVFTSGGTEADNLALFGPLGWPPQGHLVVSAIEHPAVLEPASALENAGVRVTRLPVDGEGRIDPDDLRDAMCSNIRLVSVMAANNELGTLQPTTSLAAICREAGVLFHTDAVQAVAWVDLRPLAEVADLITVTAHKIGGPPGIGALWIRSGVELEPLVRGGGQQAGRRGGTEPTALIVGFGAACSRVRRERVRQAERVRGLRDRLEAGLLDAVPGAHRIGAREERLPNTSLLCLERSAGSVLVARLDVDGVAASAGSACSSGVSHPSHVLEAIGVPERLRGGALRLSLGYESTTAEIDAARQIIASAIGDLRRAGVGAIG